MRKIIKVFNTEYLVEPKMFLSNNYPQILLLNLAFNEDKILININKTTTVDETATITAKEFIINDNNVRSTTNITLFEFKRYLTIDKYKTPYEYSKNSFLTNTEISIYPNILTIETYDKYVYHKTNYQIKDYKLYKLIKKL